MSIAKILLIIVLVAILCIALIVYSLSPTIKTLSSHPKLKSLIGKELKVMTEAYLITVEEGQYVFTSHILTEQSDYPGTRVATVSIGEKIIFDAFKTYRSNLGAGINRLYALGRFTHQGEVIEFEYALASLNDDAATIIPKTIWQDDNDEQIILNDN